MVKMLIADRDYNERLGLQWLINSYSFSFSKLMLQDTIDGVIESIETHTPEIVFLELDMIPTKRWKEIKDKLNRYVTCVVALTTEATFDRAMQAIDIRAISLLVKPQTPNLIRKTLQKCLHKLTNQDSTQENVQNHSTSDRTYQALFDEQTSSEKGKLIVLQTENPVNMNTLVGFLKAFHFQTPTDVLTLDQHIVCVLKNSSVSSKKEALRILQEWNEVNHEPLAIVIDPLEDNNRSMYELYHHAKKVMNLTFYKGYRQVLAIDEKFQWATIDPFLDPIEQRKWIDMLQAGDVEPIKQWMYDEFMGISSPYPEPGLIRTRLTSILAQVRRFMKTFKLNEGVCEENYHRVFEEILYNPVLSRIVQSLLLFITEILSIAIEQRHHSRADAVEKGIQYIEAHYESSSLSLQDVADYVKRSPAYLSYLLSTRQGITFRQLLTDIRIKQAKQLLLETDHSIQEIAEKTGFSYANYFSRIFKESTGETPSNYRKQRVRTMAMFK